MSFHIIWPGTPEKKTVLSLPRILQYHEKVLFICAPA